MKYYVLTMEVSQKTQDSFILEAIHRYFGVGSVIHEVRGISKFKLTTRADLFNILIPHFNNHPLLGYKESQYFVWLQILYLTATDRSPDRDAQLEILIQELASM